MRSELAERARDRALTWAAALYATGLVLHSADHARRGLDVLTKQVFWVGNFSAALALFAIILVLARHHWAPAVAAATGLAVALGVAAVHLLPQWSAFSDSFPGARGTGVTAASWVVVLIEIAGAAAMGVTGFMALRREAASRRSGVPLTG